MVDLEKLTKDKVEAILAQAGSSRLTLRELEQDISDRLDTSRLLGLHVFTHLPFKTAKKFFKREYLRRVLIRCGGNVSAAARLIRQDRRTLHRDIKELQIDVEKMKLHMYTFQEVRREPKDLLGYQHKALVDEDQLRRAYGLRPRLGSEIAGMLPLHQPSWKEAMREFEKAYLTTLYEQEKGNLSAMARRAKIRYETLHRKMKKLKIS